MRKIIDWCTSNKENILWAWIVFFLILLVRGDGYFPLPKTINPSLFRSIVFFQTILLVGCFILILVCLFKTENQINFKISDKKMISVISISYVLILILDLIQEKRFQQFGYSNHFKTLLLFVFISVFLLTILWNKNRFWAILVSALVLKLYPIFNYPLISMRSDMLPIIQKAAGSMLNGLNMYQYYLLDNQVFTQTVRFPGIVVAYIPAVILHLDLRFILLISELLFFYMVYKKWGESSYFIPGLALLLFFPYWHYRHELYETPFWVILLATVLSLEKKQPFLHFILFAVLFSFHQWGILFAPFFFIYLMRSTSFAYTFKIFVSASILSLLFVSIACRGQFSSFLEHVFYYYNRVLAECIRNDSFSPVCLYFTPWLAKVTGHMGLKIFNAVVQLSLIVIAFIHLKRLAQLFVFLACSLFLVLLTNVLAWTYQYLLVGILLWVSFMAREQEQPIIA